MSTRRVTVVASAPPDAVWSPGDEVWVAGYLRFIRVEKRLAARSVEVYSAALVRLCGLCARDGLTLVQVQPAHVRRWVAQLYASGHNGRGIALVLSGWRGLYTWLGRQGWVVHNPVQGIKAPRVGKPLPKALGVEEAIRLVEAAPEQGTPALLARDRCVVELLYGCGLRLGELVGLDVVASDRSAGWVDVESGDVHVRGKGSKWRSVPVGAPALAALADWVGHRQAWAGASPALFIGARGERLSPQQLRARLRQRSLQAGLAAPVHPHMLRHSFASHVLQSSSDLRAVQDLLGHANIGTTQVYTRLDFQHLAKAYEAAHPRAKKR
ncbi:MAG: hypothetical protein RJA09_1643 [Pseudomonadota bacterium]